MNLMQNPLSPTRADYQVVRRLLDKLKDHVKTGACDKFLNDGKRAKFLALTPPPVKNCDEENYGSVDLELKVLAHYTKLNIFVISPLERDTPHHDNHGVLGPNDVNPFITHLSGPKRARLE
jgi:hypothetical protein